jgi:hypothetical protein
MKLPVSCSHYLVLCLVDRKLKRDLCAAEATTFNYAANTQLQEYLISRIKRDNHNVKYKCLVIIKVRAGRTEM